MDPFLDPGAFIAAALQQLAGAPRCPTCGNPVVFIGQGGEHAETGQTHACVLDLLDSPEGERFRETVAEANAEKSADRESAEKLAAAIMTSDTVEDLLRQV